METVASHAFRIELLRNGEAVGNLRMASMKSRVETCHLWQPRVSLHDGLDGGEVVELMQGSQRRQPLEAPQHAIRHQGRMAEFWPAVNDPVSDRQWQAAGNLFAQEWNGHVEGRGQGGYLRCLPCLVRNHIPRRRLRQQTRLGANPLDLPFQAQLQLIV